MFVHLKTGLVTAAVTIGLTVMAQAATVNVNGSTTVATNILTPHKAAIEQQSGQSLNITANGTGRGIADLMAGKAHVAMISAPLDTVVAKANKKSPGSVDGSQLQEHQIGATTVAFVVHPSNGVKNLTMAQIADILSGKIANWKDVGGADAPIVVVAETKGGGVRSMVEKEVLGGGEITANVRALPIAPQVVKIVGQVPRALGIAVDKTVNDSVAAVATDSTIEQPLILVTKGAPSADIAKVIEAARSAGS